jgi:hypothetical protein
MQQCQTTRLAGADPAISVRCPHLGLSADCIPLAARIVYLFANLFLVRTIVHRTPRYLSGHHSDVRPNFSLLGVL